MRSAMAGRWTLSTAWRPSRSTHPCTWAIDAADSGTGSNEANSSSAEAPRSSSTIASARSAGNGGTSASVRRQASASGAGNIPGEEAIICPSLTNVGPSAMNASTSARLTASPNARRAAASLRRRSVRRGWRTAKPTVAATTRHASTSPISAPRTSSRGPNRVRLGAGAVGGVVIVLDCSMVGSQPPGSPERRQVTSP
jgi:hypothetical protein